MVKAIYTNKKGIYRDLYTVLNAENQQEEPRKRKGIYANLYRQINEDKLGISQQISFQKNRKKREEKTKLLILFQNAINIFISKAMFFLSSAAGELKILILAFLIAKKPINSYIENNLPLSQDPNYNRRKYGR